MDTGALNNLYKIRTNLTLYVRKVKERGIYKMQKYYTKPGRTENIKLAKELTCITEAIGRGDTEIILEVSNKEFSISDIYLIVSEVDSLVRKMGKLLDFGFKVKENTIKAKFIIEEIWF